MIINDIFPQIKHLDKSDKIRLLQYLVTEIARDEGINNIADENQFWLNVSQPSLKEIWEHPEEEVYNELL
ncbi:MAG TPA: hypothetical protein V6C58_02450 [Allocoleopsis sp.]